MADPVVDVGAPPPATGSGTSTYLGVPNNYVYNPPGNVVSTAPDPVSQMLGFTAQSGMQPPRYKTGDEMAIASMPPEVIAQLQSELATAGLISASAVVHAGLADSATTAAFKALLSFANVNGTDWQTAIGQLDANPPIKAAKPVEIPNPIDEDNALYSAAKTLFGHDPTGQQLSDFRPYYNSIATKPQTPDLTGTAAATDAAASGLDGVTQPGGSFADQNGAGTITAIPTVDQAAQAFLRQTAPGEIGARQTATKYATLLKILGG